MEILLIDIVKLFGLAIVVLLICAQARIPGVVGLLITGVLCGPHGLGLIAAVHEVEMLSEIGVVLLLFSIGLEFSLAKLIRIRRLVLLGGLMQVSLTILVIALLGLCFSIPPRQALFFGFLVCVSSTAIVLRLLHDRAEISSPHGQSILGILIFQDIAVVPLVLMVPFLAGTAEGGQLLLLLHLGKGVLILGAVFIAAMWGVPHLLFQIARTRNSQLFILSVLFLCFAVAWLTSAVGLSLALGAFLAGLVISESEYSSHAVGHILPFQEVFTSFFFISIGMLLDVSYVFEHPVLVWSATFGVIAVKAIIAGAAISLIGYPLRTALLTGLGLCQVGEFAFIISAQGMSYDLISGESYQLFLSVALLSMGLTPLWIALGPKVVGKVLAMRLPERLKKGADRPELPEAQHHKDHLVIIGFGVCGRNLAWAAKLSGIPYVILEMNPDTVRKERKKGEPIYFGDAAHGAVLEHVDINTARIVVIAISDPIATRRMVEVIRRASSRAYIVARTRYLHELQPVRDLGADDVIPEEFETSIEIFTRVLRKYLIPQDEIEKFTAELRTRGYRVLRTLSEEKVTLTDLKMHLADMEIGAYRLPPGSNLVGMSLEQSHIRQEYGVTVLMIRRGVEILSNPLPSTTLQDGDVLVVFGEPNQLMRFSQQFKQV